MTFSTLGTDTTTNQPVTINKTVRPQGLYIVGRQGTGKSGLLENLIIQDIKQGLGVCVVDPHHTGGITDTIIARLPANREQDVILLDIRDNQFPFGLNLFACSDPTDDLAVQEVVDRVMHVFDKLLGVTPETPLIRQYLRNCTYTLVANPGFTMAEILLLLTEKHCRQTLVANVTDPQVLVFWKQYEAFSPNVQEERSSSLQRRVEEFLQRLTNNIVGQSKSTIDFRAIMDDQKILLVKLDNLRLSSVTNLIGSLFIAAFLTAASTRMRKQNIFNIYADEFQNFATEDFVKLIEEARKFGIGITIAHQNRAQLELSNKQAEIELKKRVLNVGSLVVFCVPTDANELAGQFDTTPPPAEERPDVKLTPVGDPVEFIVSGKRHPTPIVNEFCIKLTDLVRDANQPIHRGKFYPWQLPEDSRGQRARPSPDDYGNEAEVEGARFIVKEWNEYFYKIMVEKNPFQEVPMVLCAWMAVEFGLPFYEYQYPWQRTGQSFSSDSGYDTGYLSVFVPKEFGFWKRWMLSFPIITTYNELWLVPDEQLDKAFDVFHTYVLEAMKAKYTPKLQEYFQWLYEKFEMYDEPFEILKLNRAAKNNPLSQAVEPIRDKPYFNYWSNDHSGYDINLLKYPGIIHYKGFELEHWDEVFGVEEPLIPLEQLAFEKKRTYDLWFSSYFSPHGQELVGWMDEDNMLVIPGYIWRLKPGTLEEHFDLILRPLVQFHLSGRESFISLVKQLRAVVKALAEQPITSGSGVYENVPRTQRTFADMQNEIANQLVDLPDYVARVKIKGEPEYLIQTLDPKKQADKPLYGQHLNDRIERIKLHNRTAGYTRPRQDVENEISMRQDALRQAQQPLQRQRRYPVEPKPLQPASSNIQLEQAIAALTPERHKLELQNGLTTLEIFEEWREQEAQKFLTVWLNKLKEAQ